MARVALYFASSPSSPELVRWEYQHQKNLPVISSERGIADQNDDTIGSFKWTSAVKALCYLLSKTALCLAHDLPLALAEITGERGMPVASLDDALYKEPRWLVNFFGLGSDCISSFREIFLRNNPGLKRAGPVSISLNEKLLSPFSVCLYSDNERLTSATSIFQFCEKLGVFSDSQEDSLNKFVTSNHTLFRPGLYPRFNEPSETNGSSSAVGLFEIYLREISRALRETNIFSRNAVAARIELINSHPSKQHIASRSTMLVDQVDLDLLDTPGLRWHPYDSLRDYLEKKGPLRIWASPAHAGALVILNSLIRATDLNIEVAWHFAHALEIISGIQNATTDTLPDAILVNVGTISSLLGQRYKLPYRPYMRMPYLSHGIITRDRKAKTIEDITSILSMTQEPSSASFFLDEIVANRDFRMTSGVVREVEPREIAQMLSERERGVASILWFPFYALHARYNNCQILQTNPSPVVGETFLCLREGSLPGELLKREFSASIRNAWLGFLEDEQLLEMTVRDLLNDAHFDTFIRSCSGLNMVSAPLQ